MKYNITIGIECHVQLATKTKLFSEVDNDARDKEPNSCVSPVDYALPGMLPRLNKEAVKLAVRVGHALNSEINLYSRFDRKHYYYPDLPKGYQISQLYHPIIGAGFIELPDGTKIRIEHAHMEEDAGKLTHFANYSLVDLNRAGTPLIEIVSMPDIHSAEHARDYCKELWRAMTYAGVTYGDLYNGNMRFDVNISLAPEGAKELGTRAEIKNLNSFRSVERAVEYEYQRQSRLLDKGEKVVQETRGWSDDTGKTTSQRSKEEAQDYRYMPEPDIPPIRLTQEFVDEQKSEMPLLPRDYRAIFKGAIADDILEVLLDYKPLMDKLGELYGIGTDSLDLPSRDLFCDGQNTIASAPATAGGASGAREGKAAVSRDIAVKRISNFFSSVLLAEEKSTEMLNDLPSAKQLNDLAEMQEKSELSSTGGKDVFLHLFDPQMKNKSTKDIAKELGVIQQNDTGALEKIVDEVLALPETQKAQEDFRSGEEKVIGFLVGQVMKASKGQANPAIAQKILREKLSK
ncbi:Asp-tRNA(Asn)/Glu-tRNA(Gln) amidotransferase subunit GatB [Candidatus Saccharibacteria bacterium]|nr:Asp-tRNA(Asn)/Glu-tRNA(Gln) amidotransferase subunit GatB [Candidatus Saccharibacteria bacterium]